MLEFTGRVPFILVFNASSTTAGSQLAAVELGAGGFASDLEDLHVLGGRVLLPAGGACIAAAAASTGPAITCPSVRVLQCGKAVVAVVAPGAIVIETDGIGGGCVGACTVGAAVPAATSSTTAGTGLRLLLDNDRLEVVAHTDCAARQVAIVIDAQHRLKVGQLVGRDHIKGGAGYH